MNPNRPALGSYRRTNGFRISTINPDAMLMRTKNGTSPGYHNQDVVDESKRRIILAALVTPADQMENVPLRDLLWRVCFRRTLRPGHVTGDTSCGTVENIVALEDAGFRAFFPLSDVDHGRVFFGRDEFIYDAVRNQYLGAQRQPVPRGAARAHYRLAKGFD